jgi:hypothetical protein
MRAMDLLVGFFVVYRPTFMFDRNNRRNHVVPRSQESIPEGFG